MANPRNAMSRPMRMAGALVALSLLGTTSALAARKMQFWNLTSQTIDDLRLAPAGTQNYGPNQCLNDSDKSVDADERLTLTGLKAGTYDVRLKDTKGRVCTVKGVAVRDDKPYAFSLSEKELTNCAK